MGKCVSKATSIQLARVVNKLNEKRGLATNIHSTFQIKKKANANTLMWFIFLLKTVIIYIFI